MPETHTARDLADHLPHWVPKEACTYLEHTEAGTPIRAIARAEGVHASTVLRQVRALEARREDLLVDHALNRLRPCVQRLRDWPERGRMATSTRPGPEPATPALTEEALDAEARRILARLIEPEAVLAVAVDMDKAVVVQENDAGDTVRRAVVGRDVAEVMALNNWIACDAPSRISRYRITPTGRSALNRMLARAENRAFGLAEAPAAFTHGARCAAETPPADRKYHAPETPLSLLARRRDRTGERFLPKELLGIGKRFQEDFEMAGLPRRPDRNWDQYLAEAAEPCAAGGPGSDAARMRVVGALRDLGPGLGDVALRCCCYLEGLESIEARMGWSARSGKVVLRISLQRLRLYYQKLGDAGGLMG
ncbi:MAG: DUF6456 domain-containing protein [Roseovarius sp.]